MPTYEYACRDCGERLEVTQSFGDDALTECPQCEGRLRKVFTPTGVILKGGGWHVKEYSSSNRPKARKEQDVPEKAEDSGGKDTGDAEGKEGKGDSGERSAGSDSGGRESSGGSERASA